MKIMEMLRGKIGLFFAVNALASIGLNIGVVGVSWFIINTTKQNEILGLYGAISLLSSFVMLIFCGSIIDKYNKIRIMEAACLGQSVVFVSSAVLYLLNVPVLYIVYFLAVLNTPFMVLFITASRGAIPLVLESEDFAQGNAIIEITVQIGAMFAAVLTGFLYYVFGFSVLILLGAALLLCAAILLFFCKYIFEYESATTEGFWANMKHGISYLAGRREIFFYGLAVFAPTIVISASNTVIPGYVEQYLGSGSVVYGVGDMLFAFGALIAGFTISKIVTKNRRNFWKFGLFAASILSLLFFVVNKSVSGFWIGIFINGLLIAGLRVLLTTALMEVVESQYLGRCLALLTAVSVILQAGFSYVIGVSMDYYGAACGYIVLAFIMFCGFIIFNFFKPTAR